MNIRPGIFNYILATIVIIATAFVCIPLADTQNYHVVSFILLFAVSLLSTFQGIGPVLLASTLSALVWNYFFIPPHLTFKIDKTEDLLIFAMFFIIALVNGVLTTRVRRQERLAREREKRTSALFQLTKELSRAGGMDEVFKAATTEIERHFNLDAVFILQDGQGKLLSAGKPGSGIILTPDEVRAAEWAFDNLKKAGAHTSQPFCVPYTFFPLRGSRLNPGVAGIKIGAPFPDEQQSYWETFLAQISSALEREFLGEMAQKVRFLDESGRLYKTLFNSISHELRIPVATIMGASDSIINSIGSEEVREELCREIFTASLRLNRLIENLLNISRLESGHLSVRLDWCDVNDLFNKVIGDLQDEVKQFRLKVEIQEEMPMVRIDFGLMEQVLYNLVFNATQYACSASQIDLIASFSDSFLTIEVSDNGPGLTVNERDRLFDKFIRVNEGKTGGLGLGLSIARGFVEAHNGEITAVNRKEGGARFIIRIPSERAEIKI